jgi:hypothetical protein
MEPLTAALEEVVPGLLEDVGRRHADRVQAGGTPDAHHDAGEVPALGGPVRIGRFGELGSEHAPCSHGPGGQRSTGP